MYLPILRKELLHDESTQPTDCGYLPDPLRCWCVVGVLFVSVIAITAENLVTDTLPIPSYFVSSWVAFAGNCSTIFIVGLAVFGLFSTNLYGAEEPRYSAAWAHVRHCWSLYLMATFLVLTYSLLILFGYVLFFGFDAERDLTLFIATAYAILLDVLIGRARRRRWLGQPNGA